MAVEYVRRMRYLVKTGIVRLEVKKDEKEEKDQNKDSPNDKTHNVQ